MPDRIIIRPPLSDDTVVRLAAGDRVLISGVIFTGRDAAHKRMVEQVEAGHRLPLDLDGQIIYYVGPTPPKPGMPIGAAGPTTSYRMDPYAPILIERGLKGMIGKGLRGDAVIAAMQRHRAVYFAATGGAGALISKTIRRAEIVAYADLGTEAVRRLEVEEFPAIVVVDAHGNDLYRQGRLKYRRG
ncbi:MAG: Fe-S-containing hydro-lyase [Desulfobacterales bacterium]|jgi:fumarate hydratase subunit beta|nr:Fe-S-containing hydro-lyase [Desulfobacterales bacterium]